jgi:glucose-6-phosphate 1-dehydrogenase
MPPASAPPAPKASPAPPCIMVLFGAGGDLAKRLLIPSLYNLAAAGLLSPGFKVLGLDVKAGDDESFRGDVRRFTQEISAKRGSEFGQAALDPAAMAWLAERLFYQASDFGVDESYRALGARIAELGGEGGSVLFYLAVAPRFFGEIVERLAAAGLTREPDGAFRRVVIEKPFGSDLASATALNERILRRLAESQVYRIDHFLGKETVRNIIVTRFANGVFEPLWNRLHIDHVQITAAETVGVELRGGFYDRTGALRDMVPNHLFHLLAMIAMEAPNTFDPAELSAERARVIRAIRRLSPEEALANSVRGQYRAGVVDGREVADYRREPNVAPDSQTETCVALKLMIDNWRWGGVPFYLRTGKAMNVRDTHVAISFKQAPTLLFDDQRPNMLVLQIQPREGISLQFEVKRPGPEVQSQPVTMDFCYANYFKAAPSTGYETLIHDALIGDRTRYKSADEILFGWAAVQPFLDAWAGGGGEVRDYAAGSQGPALADALLASDGRAWRALT